MKQIRILAFLSSVFFTFTSAAQRDTSRFNIGLSFPQLMNGTPEIMSDYFFRKFLGVSFNTGYSYKPAQGYTGVRGGLFDLEKLSGAYFKLGLKFRIPTKDRDVTPFVQLFYVGSLYNIQVVGDNRLQCTPTSSLVFVNGLAMATGVDFRLYRRWALKAAIQMGYSKINNYSGNSLNNFQPGLGIQGALLSNQLIAGLVYKI